MLSLDLGEMRFEFKDGAIKHVGASNKSGTAKLYDVTEAEVREFGDKRAKLAFEDDDGNEIEVALFPDHLGEIRAGIEALERDGELFD